MGSAQNKSTQRHTPGPWRDLREAGIKSDSWTCGKPLARCYGANKQANARLIAAAPTLLWCLEELLEHIEWRRRTAGEIAGENDCTHRARAAILSAGGVA